MNDIVNSKINTALLLIEEELYQRLNPSVNAASNNQQKNNINETNVMFGGTQINNIQKTEYIPGKFEAIRYSFQLPINTALRGSAERLALYKQK